MNNNCFSIYHTSWLTSGPKSNFIWDNLLRKAILFLFGCSEVNSTWLITSELANQCMQKVLFTCVVYTNSEYLSRNTSSIFYNYWIDLESSVCCSTLLFCGATSEVGLRRSFGTILITFSWASSRKEIRKNYLLAMVTVNLIQNFEKRDKVHLD